ncbi:GlxA family transcriptional regulator [Polyangium sorediatum]|uniref:Helix-turn-helix domain-containing protein n=1 Tax=Polyangium sorediatum TaxID=889274 RepID=A0ABT6P5A1_9BACT|nr:helix-turn-helix domain-containing protein [Polyangium sorediatum]MDI1435805.1 helix-turn-helix domain-containing protein [Polyangium sorediatum]
MARRTSRAKDSGARNSSLGPRPLAVNLVVTDRCFGSGIAVTLDVLGTANLLSSTLGGPPQLFHCTVRSFDGHPVRSSVGTSITVDGPVDAGAADVVLVFGPGMADARQVLVDVAHPSIRTLSTHLERAAAAGAILGASCSSTFLLAEAGVLDGGPATTSWWLAPAFRARYPAVRLVEDELVVASERTITAGAALAQIDLALHFVRRFAGAELAHAVARYLIVDDARSAQGPFVMIQHLANSDRVVTKAEAILRADLTRPLDVDALAREVGVTPRTLGRRFVAATGLPPASFLRRLRLEVAAGLLRSTTDAIATIAARVGYEDERAFRRAFTKDMSDSPSRFRRAGATVLDLPLHVRPRPPSS